jgi:hypothetical protein
MTMTKTIRAVIGAAALAFAGVAGAVPVHFDLASTSSVNVTSFSETSYCGLSICDVGISAKVNPLIGSLNTTLSAGQTWALDFFTLNLSGFGTGSGTLQASLAFDAPTGAPIASGSAAGSFLTAFVLSGGSLTWTSQPGKFMLTDGTSYSVLFENLNGVTFGNSVNVRALLTLNNEPGQSVSVPEPGTLGLFGFGLLAAGWAARRRVAK